MRPRVVVFMALLALVLGLAGCGSVPTSIPVPDAGDLGEFKPSQRRVSVAPKIRHVVVDDAAAVCGKVTGLHKAHACAEWNQAKTVCTIYTERTTTNVFIGHEVRHCFEGTFHD